MFKIARTFAVLTTLSFALWALPAASLADDDHGGYDDDHGRNSSSHNGEAKLRGFYNDGVNTVKAEYEAKARKNETKFEGEVKFALPSSTFDITDVQDARNTDLEMELFHGADVTPYATCVLDLKSAKTRRGPTRVEYKVEVKNRNSFLQSKRGYCDVDLAVPGVQAGVPAVQAGDTFKVITADGSTIDGSLF